MIVTGWLRDLWRWLCGKPTCNVGYARFEDTAELMDYLDQVSHPASETIITRMTGDQIEARIRGKVSK